MSQRIKLPMLVGAVLLLSVGRAVEPVVFDYKNNGLDWPDRWAQCGQGPQSPIDLRTVNHSDPFPINYDDHDYIQSYESLLEPTLLQRGVNLYYDFPDAEGTTQPTSRLNFFNSSWAVDIYGAAGPIFNASQIFFHSKSEHTVDGKRYDLEMQTLHYPDDPSGKIKGASVSILFDTKAWHNYTEEEEETIDGFFESLVLEDLERFDEDGNPRDAFSFEVYFSTVAQLVQENNRWVYQGSLSMPPCTGPYFVQVFDRVLPIKEEYLEMIQEWQKREKAQKNPSLFETGNWRETSILDTHNVTYLIQIEDREIEIIEKHGDLALLAVLLVIAVGLSSAVCYFLCPSFTEAIPEAADLDDQAEEEDESPYADQSPVPTSEQELVKQQQMEAEKQEAT